MAEAVTVFVCDRLVDNACHAICATIVGNWQELSGESRANLDVVRWNALAVANAAQLRRAERSGDGHQIS